MDIENVFPKLASSGYQVTSPATARYNCIAWAAGDVEQWWEPTPEHYWPDGVPFDFTTDALVRAFESLGFRICDDPSPQEGREKIAIYGDSQGFTHAARQLPNGSWSSKLGQDVDIEHNSLDALAGDVYGTVVHILERVSTSSDEQLRPSL